MSLLDTFTASSPRSPLDKSLSDSFLSPFQLSQVPPLPCPPGSGDDGGGAPAAASVLRGAVHVSSYQNVASKENLSSSSLAKISPDTYFEEDYLLRAQARACVSELFERERLTWQRRLEDLEGECAELDCAIETVLSEAAGADVGRSHSRAGQLVAGLSAVTSIRTSAIEAQLGVEASEREEALLEAVARERANNSTFHANDARSQEIRPA
jgi:hypothetical protein